MSTLINSSGNIIVRAGSDFQHLGVNYKKEQLLAAVQKAEFSLEYETITKTPRQGTKIYGSSTDTRLRRITVQNFPFNNFLSNLIFGAPPQPVILPHVQTFRTDENGYFALPITSNTQVQKLQVYKTNYEPVEFTDTEEGIVKTALINETVLVSFETIESAGVQLKLGNNSLPYFDITCLTRGSFFDIQHNEYKQSPTNLILHIERAALDIDPYFFFGDTHNPMPVSFNVVYDDVNQIQYV